MKYKSGGGEYQAVKAHVLKKQHIETNATYKPRRRNCQALKKLAKIAVKRGQSTISDERCQFNHNTEAVLTLNVQECNIYTIPLKKHAVFLILCETFC